MRQLKLIIAALFLIWPFAATADVITFNGTADDGGFVSLGIGDTYSESGFTLTVLSGAENFLVDNDFDSNLNGFDDDVLAVDELDSSVLFTRDGGGLFDAINVLVGQWDGVGGIYEFTGFFGGGGTITGTALGCGIGCIDLFEFTGFVGLESLQVSVSRVYMVMDDLQLTAVPEPGTLALLGLGLVGLAATRRRRKV